MPSLEFVPAEPPPAIFARVRFDAAIENLAFRRLTELDLDAAASAFLRLADAVAAASAGDDRAAVLLLHDVLQRANRRLYAAAEDDPAYHRKRAALVEIFAPLASAEEARRAFPEALDLVLAPWRARAADTHPLVDRARSYIDTHARTRIGLSAVARHLNVSSNYLSRVFRRETGSTLTAYVHRVRLARARVLLAAGGRSISEIAYLVGYQTYRDFHRNFVKYERASPRQLRRRIAAGSAPPSPQARSGRGAQL